MPSEAMNSPTLRTQIHFIHEPIKLIHIPICSYGRYVQPLLQILYPLSSSNDQLNDLPVAPIPWMNRHNFLNLSITPVECSLFCSKSLCTAYFAPIIDCDNKTTSREASRPSISAEDFHVISVEGEGLDAGERVLELTTPLAMAGISLFFITTYFSDYILVPSSARCKVVEALQKGDFAFDNSSSSTTGVGDSFGHQPMTSTSAFERLTGHLPLSPPPTSLSELQERTTTLLKKHCISPEVHRELRLHHCAASRSSAYSSALHIGLMQCLAHPPAFLSMTLTATEPASLLLEEATRSRFETHNVGSHGGSGGVDGSNFESVLMGSRDVLVPITLDLSPLGESATGIVCGVAGKLLGGEEGQGIEMSYLSTARGAAVLVDEGVVDGAVQRLRKGEGPAGGLDVV